MAARRSGLAHRRKALGLSQEAFAERLEVERTTVARWEAGTTEPHAWIRPRLAQTLEISLEHLDVLLHEQSASATDGSQDDTARHQSAPAWIAICGSRSPGSNHVLIDSAVAELARIVALRDVTVNHGPVGVGIEVMTYAADNYHRRDRVMTPALFGRENVIAGASLVLVLGGGKGTAAEVAIARERRIDILPLPATGGTARSCYEYMRHYPRPGGERAAALDALEACADATSYGFLVEAEITRRTESTA